MAFWYDHTLGVWITAKDLETSPALPIVFWVENVPYAKERVEQEHSGWMLKQRRGSRKIELEAPPTSPVDSQLEGLEIPTLRRHSRSEDLSNPIIMKQLEQIRLATK